MCSGLTAPVSPWAHMQFTGAIVGQGVVPWNCDQKRGQGYPVAANILPCFVQRSNLFHVPTLLQSLGIIFLRVILIFFFK